MNQEQLKILSSHYIASPEMAAAVEMVIIQKETAYAAEAKYGVSRSAIGRQVRLMRGKAALILAFNTAGDAPGWGV